jgi:hypothetical protein
MIVVLLCCLPVFACASIDNLTDEFRSGLQRRGIQTKYDDMAAFFADRLDASAGEKTFGDKTGNCRLTWCDAMLRRPLESIGMADAFTRDLHAAAGRTRGTVTSVTRIASAKLDVPELGDVPPARVSMKRADATLLLLVRAILTARREIDGALAPLTPVERDELRAKLYEQTSSPRAIAPFFADQHEGRRVSDLLEKLDRRSLLRSASAIAVLTEPGTRSRLAQLALRKTRGKTVVTEETPAGKILFGGSGANTYRLDELHDVCAVIDVGGDDTYIEGALSADRPVLVIIDLAGNDRYQGEQPGIQGGGILGLSLLLDARGDDSYQADDVAQGACLGGIGLLLDLAGDDRYTGDTRVQGSAVAGMALLLDRTGNDAYHAALLAQGVGGPFGFGLLDDLAGNDSYYAGGKYPDNYDDTPGYSGWSQGVGVGPRGVANGGIGCLLDGRGDDVYEADYFSHGGGYWFAIGCARDFGGNDQRLGATRLAFDGGERNERRFLRWGYGFGCHYAAGYLFDDDGNDVYHGDIVGIAFTWDVGITALIDRTGDDQYLMSSSGICTCSNSGLTILYDGGGNDRYAGTSLGIADAVSQYHKDTRAYNFSLLLDVGGQDEYPETLRPHLSADTEYGWAGGFVIDR